MQLIIGDNPFFSISHLSSDKSRQYLNDPQLFHKASDILRASYGLGYENFMVSSHDQTVRLLRIAGYFDNEVNLPKIILNIPNVHSANERATNNGVASSIIEGSITGWVKGFSKNFSLNPLKTLCRVYVENALLELPKNRIEYVCFHNIFTDMLLGFARRQVFEILAESVLDLGYKPAFITLNPSLADKFIPDSAPICTYYNLREFNMTASRSDLVELISSTRRDFWAMGILASGEVAVSEAISDANLREFSKVIYASSNIDRVEKFSINWFEQCQ